MSPRAIRRAQERHQAKLARKQERQDRTADSVPQPKPEKSDTHWLDVPPEEFAALRASLRERIQSMENENKTPLSEPRTQITAALTGRAILLPADDAAAYEKHIRAYQQELQPVGLRETELVQALADTAWRLERITALEMAIFARGRSQFAAQFENEDPSVRPGLIELETYLGYEKQLRNLQTQQGRLRRQREKDTAELRQVQKERRHREEQQEPQPEQGQTKQQSSAPPANGFVFSTHAPRPNEKPRHLLANCNMSQDPDPEGADNGDLWSILPQIPIVK